MITTILAILCVYAIAVIIAPEKMLPLGKDSLVKRCVCIIYLIIAPLYIIGSNIEDCDYAQELASMVDKAATTDSTEVTADVEEVAETPAPNVKANTKTNKKKYVKVNVQQTAKMVSDTKRELTDVSVYTNKGGRWVKTPVYDIDFNNGMKVGSIGNVSRQLGYYSGECIFYYTDGCIGCTIMDLFTKEIICLYFNNKNHNYDCEILDDEIARKVIGDKDKEYNHELSSLTFLYRINEACGKKTISMSRVEKDLNTKAVNNVITDDVHKVKYTFKGGFLVKYETFSGFNYRAEECKGSDTFEKVYANAKKYYSDNNDVVKYVNRQFDDIFAMKTDHAKVAMNEHVNYNFSLINAFIKKAGVSERDFRFIAPEVTDKVVNGNKTIYTHKLGMCFVFVNGKLTDAYMKK